PGRGIRLSPRHALSRQHHGLAPGLAAPAGHAHARPPRDPGRRHPRRGPHPEGRDPLVRGRRRGRRARGGAGHEGARPLRGWSLRRLVGRGRARPLRVRLRHGLQRAGPQPAGHLRTGRMSMDPIALAVIGGTGLYRLDGLQDAEEHQPVTRHGALSGPVRVGRIAGKRVAFLARQGEGHSFPPHLVNYRANLSALHALGAQRVLALNTVGGITAAFGPRVLACPDQLIDYTWGRVSTFCEEPGSEVLHVDMGDPYTPSLRREVLAAARRAGVDLVDGGCYGATQGPRLETRAE